MRTSAVLGRVWRKYKGLLQPKGSIYKRSFERNWA